MATRTLDLYDFSSPFITPTAPANTAAPTAPQPTATTAQARPYLDRLAENKLFNASVILLVFSAFVYSAGTVLAFFPLGAVTPAQNFGLWFGTIAGVLAMSGAITGILAMTVVRVRP